MPSITSLNATDVETLCVRGCADTTHEGEAEADEYDETSNDEDLASEHV